MSSEQNDLFCIVYVSRARQPMTVAGLLELLSHARTNNSRDGITGLLLYKDGRFMQALEGPRLPLLDLFARISADNRHEAVTSLMRYRINRRSFSDWTMGFADIAELLPAVRAKISPFLEDGFDASHWVNAPHRAMTLLTSFKEAGRAEVMV